MDHLVLTVVTVFLLVVTVFPVTCNKLYVVPRSSRILGCYIVSTKETAGVDGLLDELRSMHLNESMPDFYAIIIGVSKKILKGFFAKFSPQALDYVMTHPIVAYVEEDARYTLGQTSGRMSSISSYNWALDSIDGTIDSRYQRPCNLSGRGVDVYIMDTGIQYDHVEFGGRAEYSGCDSVDLLSYSNDPQVEQLRGRDCSGHGTGVAGAVGGMYTGIAYKATLRSVRVVFCNKTTTKTLMILGFECVLNQFRLRSPRPAILQASLQGANSPSIRRSVNTLTNHGITVVSISGNSNSLSKPMNSCKVSPGSYAGVITAGATQTQGTQFIAYSRTNMGRCVDIFSPGRYVRLPWLHNPNWHCASRTACYGNFNGVSYAAPFVSGALSLLLEKCPHLPQWKVKYYLTTKMAVPDIIDMRSVQRRYRKLTPNLYLRTGSQLCEITC